MRTIPLLAIPNQSVSFLADDVNVRYDLTLQDLGNGVMGVTIAAGGITLCNTSRAVINVPLLKFSYLQSQAMGNFMFISGNSDNYPYWDQFGGSLFLVYASALEIAALQTAADAVNPLTTLGSTRVGVTRNTVTATLQPVAMGTVGGTQLNYRMAYKGATVVEALSVNALFVRDTTTGIITQLFMQPGNNYVYPSYVTDAQAAVPPVPYTGYYYQGAIGTPPTVPTYGLPDPWGGNTAFSYSASSTTGGRQVNLIWANNAQNPAPVQVAGNAVLSAWVKSDLPALAYIAIANGAGNIPITNVWTRISRNYTQLAQSNSLFIGFSYVAGNNYYIAGVQAESAAAGVTTPGPYMPTTTAPVVVASAQYVVNPDNTITLATPLTSTQQLLWSGTAVVNF